jgi:hypothetical protein
MLLGDGLFIKQHGHFKPQFLTLKTNGNISTKLLKPFIGNYIYGGDFYSDLKYTFNDNKLHGVLKLNKIYHKDFLYLENVDIKTLQDNIKVNMNGTFFDSPITISLKSNTVINNLVVDDIDIHLNIFI